MKMIHVTINVLNLEESIEFYRDAIGLEIVGDLRDKANLPIVFLSDGVSSQIELIENKEQIFKGEGISIGFTTNNLEETHKNLVEKGYNPTEFISPMEGIKFFFIKDPNGLELQII